VPATAGAAAPVFAGSVGAVVAALAARPLVRTGDYEEIDVELLKHELAEAWYTRTDGPGYKSAHNKASVKYPSPRC
jgi:hypothetical protein